MSYSSDTKGKLILSDIKSKCCAPAELYSAVLMNGGCIFVSDNKGYIKRINALASKSSAYFIKNRIFTLKNKKGAPLWGIHILIKSEPDVILQRCCASAFIRGCFIHSGYITPPEKAARADISFKNKKALEICCKALTLCGIHYNISMRNRRELIYIKGSANVSTLLASIGAIGAMLEIENSSIVKKYMSDVNRAANCDNANIDKTVQAGLRQKILLSDFMKTAAFNELPDELKDIARMRVENESLSLTDIGAAMKPPISKSGAAHRLKKLESIASRVLGQNMQ